MDVQAKLHLTRVAAEVAAHKTRYYGYPPKQVALPAVGFTAADLPAVAAALALPSDALRLSHDAAQTTVTGQDSVATIIPFPGE